MAINDDTGWFLGAWMRSMDLKQRDLVAMTGWNKQKVSRICSGATPYNREILETLGAAMGIHPFEFLIAPQQAARFRQQWNKDGP